MSGFDASTYGDAFADVYDDWYPDVSDAAATAERVRSFGPGQRILELGTGTGRLVAALESDGDHHVVGVDASMRMLERFNPASPIACADMTTLPFAPGVFDTVLVATNTFLNLTTEPSQARCLEEMRRVLRLGGRAVIEADVPAEPDPATDRLVTTRSVTADELVITAAIRDESSQTVVGQHVQIRADGIRLRPWKVRFVSPDELDRMAEVAGLRLGDRYENWSGDPFDVASSARHVSVFVAI